MDFFEDCVTLKWVKWTKRKPKYNGSVLFTWDGGKKSFAIVCEGKLISLEGLSEYYYKEYEDTFYWLEEIWDNEKYTKHLEKLYG